MIGVIFFVWLTSRIFLCFLAAIFVRLKRRQPCRREFKKGRKNCGSKAEVSVLISTSLNQGQFSSFGPDVSNILVNPQLDFGVSKEPQGNYRQNSVEGAAGKLQAENCPKPSPKRRNVFSSVERRQPGSSHFGSRRHCLRVFRLFALFVPFASHVSRELTPRRMAGDGRSFWMGAGPRGPRLRSQKWPSAKSGSHPVLQRQQGVSSPSSRVAKAPPSRVNPEIARETALSKVQKLEQALLLKTTNRCRSRTMPQVHRKVRAEGGRVGCGACSRIQCSNRSEGSPSAFGGSTGSSNEPPGTISTVVSFSRVCRGCCVEARRRERRCDPESAEQAAGDHVFCDNHVKLKRRSADARDQSSLRVERVVAGMPRGVGTSSGRGKRDQSDGVEFSTVRWCSDNVRVDGGHGAVRSWPGRIATTWGYRG